MANKNMEIIFTEEGVHPIGPYSQAIKAAGFVFLAGQVPTDSQAKVVPGTITEKAHRMCQNTKLVLEAAGSSLEKVVKVTVDSPFSFELFLFQYTLVGYSCTMTFGADAFDKIYFENLDDFAAVNEVFGQYFVSKPARTSVQVAKLPVGCPLEMDVTALA